MSRTNAVHARRNASGTNSGPANASIVATACIAGLRLERASHSTDLFDPHASTNGHSEAESSPVEETDRVWRALGLEDVGRTARHSPGAPCLAAGASVVRRGASKMSSGASRLPSGGSRLQSGASRTSSGAKEKSSGASRTSSGAKEESCGAGEESCGAVPNSGARVRRTFLQAPLAARLARARWDPADLSSSRAPLQFWRAPLEFRKAPSQSDGAPLGSPLAARSRSACATAGAWQATADFSLHGSCLATHVPRGGMKAHPPGDFALPRSAAMRERPGSWTERGSKAR